MAAPKGNQFWKLRSEHGRDTLFASPELLWEAATEYFNWVDAHPWYKMEALKGGEGAGKIIKIPTARPYTMSAFLLYVGAGKNYWEQFRGANHEGFSGIIDQIENTMYSQKFEGAATGAFNANIIARDLGLKESTAMDMTSGGEKINGFNYVPPTEIK